MIKVSHREPDGQVHVQISPRPALHFWARCLHSRGDLFISASEFVIKAPVMPTKGLSSICIVGSSLILLGLTCASVPGMDPAFTREERVPSGSPSSSAVQGTTALLSVPQISGATVSALL